MKDFFITGDSEHYYIQYQYLYIKYSYLRSIKNTVLYKSTYSILLVLGTGVFGTSSEVVVLVFSFPTSPSLFFFRFFFMPFASVSIKII